MREHFFFFAQPQQTSNTNRDRKANGMSHGSPKRRRLDESPRKQAGSGSRQSGPSTTSDGAYISNDNRIIIALDLDAFYVSASRIRDPSLIGLPIGIKQKGILATCSYEARKVGVKKLANIKESLKICPDLILVNGEDLSFFRKLSNQVFRTVSGIVWDAKVEKLGLDELFCDVTAMIDHQLHKRGCKDGYFHLSKEDNESSGFKMTSNTFIGHAISDPLPHSPDQTSFQDPRLVLATHLACYLRQRIHDEVGLTASAGVAHNKLLAKLVCSKHKPAEQTVFAPSSPIDVKHFLDPYEVRSLNGFGSVIVNSLRTALGGETLGGNGTEWLNNGLGADPQTEKQKQRGALESPDNQSVEPPLPLTVALCRKAFSASQFVDLFGSRLGTRLWSLLQGQDDEPVVPAPPFPLQISIEDTYRNLRGSDIYDQIRVLSESLLRRLEAELVDGQRESDSSILTIKYNMAQEPLSLPGDSSAGIIIAQGSSTGTAVVRNYTEVGDHDHISKSVTSSDQRIWKRFPLGVRLSIRQGWENRVSKQTRMPVEVFDLLMSRSARAALLTSSLSNLYRSMIQQHGDKGQGINLINIAAVDLSITRPAPALGSFFSKSLRSVPESRVQESIDLQMLSQLPDDIRDELAQQYGIKLPAQNIEETFLNKSAAGDDIESGLTCPSCGAEQQPWLQHDHVLWPIRGIAPCFVQSGTEGPVSTWTSVGETVGNEETNESVFGSSQ
ncbi:unnamed protein product [Sympodiomycopsis kandeliae]